MKQVLRESLMLLGGGQYLTFLDTRELLTEIQITYPGFQALRPEFKPGSWRTAMLKAVQRRWVNKRVISGRTTFELTLLGKQELTTDFQPLRLAITGGATVCLLLKPARLITTAEAAQVRSLLITSSGYLLQPNLWILPMGEVPDVVLAQIAQKGYQYLRLAGPSLRPGTRWGGASWVSNQSQTDIQVKISTLEAACTQMSELLDKIPLKKTMHHLQISQIGRLAIEVVSEVRTLPWPWLEDSRLLSLVLESFRLSDLLMLEWARQIEQSS